MSEPDDNIIHEEEKLNNFKFYRNIAPVTTDVGVKYGNDDLIGKYTGKDEDRFTFTLSSPSSPSSDKKTSIILDLESSKKKNFVPFTEIVTSEQSLGDITKKLAVGFINTANDTLSEIKNSNAVLNHPAAAGGSKVSKKRSKTRKSKRRNRRSKKSKTRKSKRHQCRSKKIRSRLKNS